MSGRVRVECESGDEDRRIAVHAARDFARVRGASGEQAQSVADAVDIMLDYVSARAYPPKGSDPASGPLTMDLHIGDHGIAVVISDRGRPCVGFGGGHPPMEPRAVPAPLDRLPPDVRGLREVNLGPAGNRLSATVTLADFQPVHQRPAPERNQTVVATVSPAPGAPPETEDLAAAETGLGAEDRRLAPRSGLQGVTIRDGVPTDAAGIAALIFDCYGHTYAHEGFYRPEWIETQIRSGRLLSSVAVFGSEVIGHHALINESPGGAVESGIAIVQPAFRGLGILTELAVAANGRAARVGAPAFMVRPVTHHELTQRATAQWGFVDTALMLGAAPYAAHPRSALLLEYLPVDHRPRAVDLPTRYRTELEMAYEDAGLSRASDGTSLDATDSTKVGEGEPVEVTSPVVTALPGSRFLTVGRWGGPARSDLIDAIRACVQSADDVLYCDLDLHNLTTADLDDACELLWGHDFFYCGLVLFGRSGHDYLRLQRMLTDNVQVQDLHLASRAARRIFTSVLDDAGPLLPDRG